MLPAVGSLSGAGTGRHRGHLLAPPSSRTALQGIKDDYFLCLVNEKSRGGGGRKDSDAISTVI